MSDLNAQLQVLTSQLATLNDKIDDQSRRMDDRLEEHYQQLHEMVKDVTKLSNQNDAQLRGGENNKGLFERVGVIERELEGIQKLLGYFKAAVAVAFVGAVISMSSSAVTIYKESQSANAQPQQVKVTVVDQNGNPVNSQEGNNP